AAAAAAA
nr:Chain C, POLYALANINE [synthetic construct]4NAQ_B Chain B, poly A peptide [synthetic construct]6ON2_G Chain G, Bound Y2853 Substrate [Yersinia pestis]6YWY_cc Chain cc, Poly-Peptide [Neurospora crassa]7AQC_W Chain W, nascent polyalanine [Bacillus subtilis subsp. subtilis str. 168]7AQD_W Chain W, nascent polyalanine [Bacillus subtilis subsp. subtilis str. 168]